MTIKAVGHQWYWHMNTIVYSWEIKAKYGSFESYMVPDNELKLGDLRLLLLINL